MRILPMLALSAAFTRHAPLSRPAPLHRSVERRSVLAASAPGNISPMLAVSAAYTWHAPLHHSVARRSALAASAPGADEGAGEDVGGLLSPQDMRELRKRLEEVRSGDSSAATELYRLMTKDEPAQMILDFLRSSSPPAIEAVQAAVISLLGSLPRQFAVEFTTTTERFAALAYQLQMTGYLFKNAEYVLMLKSVLAVTSEAELRGAFDSIDKDASGFIDVAELKLFLARLKGGAVRVNGTLVSPGISNGDLREFLDVFDADRDAKVSWDEFRAVLGGSEMPALPRAQSRLPASAPPPALASTPPISGTVKIELEGGGQMEVDAAKYVDELRATVQAMRAELARAGPPAAPISAGSIGAYISNLPKAELQSLTGSIEPDVVSAMRQLVDHVVKSSFETDKIPPRGTEVAISRDALAQICMWLLILGYRLRQAEAKGEAQERLGL